MEWEHLDGAGFGAAPCSICLVVVSGSNVYAGTWGGFVAQWDGSTWTTMGSQMNNSVLAMAMARSTLYIGGHFTNSADHAAYRVAQWNGGAWTGLGSGMNNSVRVLTASGGFLYAGGDFTTAGGVSANHIAKWNGSTWAALGSGMDGGVSALAVVGNVLYAGGSFSKAGGVSASHIAKWNGSTWTALGSGIQASGQVRAFAVWGDDLLAGGYFSQAGGSFAAGIAQWDGSHWANAGGNLEGSVDALALSGIYLYAGGQGLGYIARGSLVSPPPLWVSWSGSSVKLSWPSAGTGGFLLEQAGSARWLPPQIGSQIPPPSPITARTSPCPFQPPTTRSSSVSTCRHNRPGVPEKGLAYGGDEPKRDGTNRGRHPGQLVAGVVVPARARIHQSHGGRPAARPAHLAHEHAHRSRRASPANRGLARPADGRHQPNRRCVSLH